MEDKCESVSCAGRFPKIIEFQTCSACNGKCLICPHRDVVGNECNYMKDDLIDIIFTEIYQHKNEVERVIPYLNNEPLLDARALEVLRRLKSLGFFVELSTNASLLNVDVARAIVEERLVDDLRISFFGGNPSDYARMMPGLPFDKVVENVQQLMQIGKSEGRLSSVTVVMVMYPMLDVEKNYLQIKRLFPDITIRKFGYLDRASNVRAIKNPTRIGKEGFDYSGCHLNRPNERMCIQWDGSVVLCSQDWRKDHCLGVVGDQTIESIWTGGAIREVRRALEGFSKMELLCRKCKLAMIKGDEGVELNFLGDRYMNEFDESKVAEHK